MRFVEDIAELERIYGQPGSAALRKVATQMTPLYRRWILSSRFCVVSTVGPAGTDGSPRGDVGPVVQELDEHRLLMPDWRGNNRMDSLRNIVADGRMSLMFLIPGSYTAVRVNGRGHVTLDDDLRGRFTRKGLVPRSIVVIEISQIYTQCARALMRSELWTAGDCSDGLPSAGDILAEQTSGEEGGAHYDAAWGARAAKTMW